MELFQSCPDFTHLGRIRAGLDDRRNERSEFRRRPSPVVGQFGVEEIEPVQRVTGVVDAPVHVHPATRTRVTLDGRARIDDFQLVFVRRHFEVLPRRDGDLGEKRSAGLPALGAPANMVVSALTLDRDGDLPVRTFARQRTAGEVRSRGLQALVNAGMNGCCHCQFPPYRK